MTVSHLLTWEAYYHLTTLDRKKHIANSFKNIVADTRLKEGKNIEIFWKYTDDDWHEYGRNGYG